MFFFSVKLDKLSGKPSYPCKTNNKVVKGLRRRYSCLSISSHPPSLLVIFIFNGISFSGNGVASDF